jgi:hypothetical protein
MRPGTPMQEFLWHVTDQLLETGFEATLAAALAASALTLLLSLWLKLSDDRSTISSDLDRSRSRSQSRSHYGEGDIANDELASLDTDAPMSSSAVNAHTDVGGRVSVEVGVEDDGENAVDDEDNEPPYLLGALVFIAVMAFLIRSTASPLHFTPPPLKVHPNVVGENERILNAIAHLAELAKRAASGNSPNTDELLATALRPTSS